MWLQAQSVSKIVCMAEPDPEEDPGYETAEEGLEQSFERLSIRDPPHQDTPNRDLQIGPRQRGELPSVELTAGVTRGCILAIPSGQTLADLDRNLNLRFREPSGVVSHRVYVVWVVPNYRGPLILPGLHTGRDTRAYDAILAANGGIFEGTRFRRVENLRTGRVIFLAESRRHRVGNSRAEVVFWWG